MSIEMSFVNVGAYETGKLARSKHKKSPQKLIMTTTKHHTWILYGPIHEAFAIVISNDLT